ncbi:MAG: hypothetical protein LBT60_07170 [Oscillospiraceae bacterium]|jgi:hypothetical protein|nr:hypothetical protein [Oscillospiraceae bacterium]
MPKPSPQLKNPLSKLAGRQMFDHLLFALLAMLLLTIFASFAPGEATPEASPPPEETAALEETDPAESPEPSATPASLLPGKGTGKASDALSTVAATPPALIILPALLAWLLFAMSAYTNAWHVGERDINLIKYGHTTYQPLKGLWGGLLAQLPGVAFAVWACLGSLWGTLGVKLYYATYLWLFAIWDAPWIFFLPAVLSPLFSLWGYHNGHRYVSLYYKIVYKDPHKNVRGKDRRLR